jgi:hypothetical protein
MGPDLRGKLRRIAIALLGMAALLGPLAARAEEPAFVTLGLGEYDIFHNDQAGDFMLEYRADRFYFIHPKLGMEATTAGAFYAYGGFNFDIPMGNHFLLTLGTAVGHYSNGSGKDLGDTVEFKSGAEIALRLRNRARLAMALYHISNAGLGSDNPGTEILGLTYSIPVGSLFQSPSQSTSRR